MFVGSVVWSEPALKRMNTDDEACGSENEVGEAKKKATEQLHHVQIYPHLPFRGPTSAYPSLQLENQGLAKL